MPLPKPPAAFIQMATESLARSAPGLSVAVREQLALNMARRIQARLDLQNDAYYDALAHMGARYAHLLQDSGLLTQQDHDLASFIEEFQQGVATRAPLNKLNRWLGYIQSQLITMDLTTVQAERDYTRPYFRPLDFPQD